MSSYGKSYDGNPQKNLGEKNEGGVTRIMDSFLKKEKQNGKGVIQS